MYLQGIGWKYGRYSAHSTPTIVYTPTAQAQGRYDGSSVSTSNYRSIAISPNHVRLSDGSIAYVSPSYCQPHIGSPLPAGWSRRIDPIKGVFFWERVVGKRVETTYTKPYEWHSPTQRYKPHATL